MSKVSSNCQKRDTGHTMSVSVGFCLTFKDVQDSPSQQNYACQDSVVLELRSPGLDLQRSVEHTYLALGLAGQLQTLK